MKKLKLNYLFLSIFFSFVITVLGCKSTPVITEEVNPLDLLDNGSSFYLKINAQEEQPLITNFICSNFGNISKNEAELASSKIDKLYLGLNKVRNNTQIQLSASCDVPSFAVNKVFNKKNNWIKEDVIVSDQEKKTNTSYSVYNNNNFLVSFPSKSHFIAGRNIFSMIEVFHLKQNKEVISESALLNPLVYEWLSLDDASLKFFATRPQSFLTALVGTNLNYKLVYARGKMNSDINNSNQYLMDLEFEFKETKVVPAAKSILMLAFGLTNSEVFLESPTHLKITNIRIAKKELYRILSL